MVGDVRRGLGRDAKTTFLIVDAQSVKNTDTAEQKDFDGGKLITGIMILQPFDGHLPSLTGHSSFKVTR